MIVVIFENKEPHDTFILKRISNVAFGKLTF